MINELYIALENKDNWEIVDKNIVNGELASVRFANTKVNVGLWCTPDLSYKEFTGPIVSIGFSEEEIARLESIRESLTDSLLTILEAEPLDIDRNDKLCELFIKEE